MQKMHLHSVSADTLTTFNKQEIWKHFFPTMFGWKKSGARVQVQVDEVKLREMGGCNQSRVDPAPAPAGRISGRMVKTHSFSFWKLFKNLPEKTAFFQECPVKFLLRELFSKSGDVMRHVFFGSSVITRLEVAL